MARPLPGHQESARSPAQLSRERAELIAILRAAFAATMTDREFLAEAERQKMLIEPMSGADAAAICDEIYRAVKPDLVAMARETMK